MNAIKCAILGIVGMLGVLVSKLTPLRVPLTDTLWRTYRRQAIVGLLLVAAIVGAATTALVKLFDPNDFKDTLVRWVHERTQRNLVLAGDLTIDVLPRLTLRTGRAGLSQRRGARELVSLDDARISFAWLPLLRRELRIDRIEVEGLRLQLVRFADGSTNLDDLAHDLAGLAPLAAELRGVRVERATLQWNDEIAWQRGSLDDLRVEVGRIADALAAPLQASARMTAAVGDVDARVQLDAQLLVDGAVGRIELARVSSRLEGQAFGIDNLGLGVAGDVTVLLRERSVSAANLALTSSWKSGLAVTRAQLVVPELMLAEQRVKATGSKLDVEIEHPNRSLSATLQLPRLDWAERTLRDTSLQGQLTLREAAGRLSARLETALQATHDAAGPMLMLPAADWQVTASHPALAAETTARLRGNAELRWNPRSARIDWAGRLADAEFKAELAWNASTRPRWRFDVETARLDLDALLAPTWLAQWADDAATLPLPPLVEASAQGRLRIGQLAWRGLRASSLAAQVDADGSTLAVEPIAGEAYGAPIDAALRIDRSAGTPHIAAKGRVAGLALRALLDDLRSTFWLDGRTDATWDLSGEGGTVGSLRQSLAGTLELGLRGGRLAGIDLAAALAGARDRGGQRVALPPREFDAQASTPLREFDARIEVRRGRALGHAVTLAGPAITAAGEGMLVFDSGLMDLRLQAMPTRDAPSDGAGASLPLQLHGPWRAPRFAFDGGVAAEPTAAGRAPDAPGAASSGRDGDDDGVRGTARLAATAR